MNQYKKSSFAKNDLTCIKNIPLAAFRSGTIYWLPKYASWMNQVEIIFSKVQRDLLTPNDFQSKASLEDSLLAYCNQLNTHPKPVRWTYTKGKFLFQFAPPDLQKQLAG